LPSRSPIGIGVLLFVAVCLFPSAGFGNFAEGRWRLRVDAKKVAVNPGDTPTLRWVFRNAPQADNIQSDSPDILPDLQLIMSDLKNAKDRGTCSELVLDVTPDCGLLASLRPLATSRRFSIDLPAELKKAPGAGSPPIDTTVKFHYSTDLSPNSKIGELVIQIQTDAYLSSGVADRRTAKPPVSAVTTGNPLTGADGTKISIELQYSAVDLATGGSELPPRTATAVEQELLTVATAALREAVTRRQVPQNAAIISQQTAVEDRLNAIYRMDPGRPTGWPQAAARFTHDGDKYLLLISGLRLLNRVSMSYQSGDHGWAPNDTLSCIAENAGDRVTELL